MFQVQKIHIEYARTAKRLDIKKLKHRMWEILTPDDDTKDVRSGFFLGGVRGAKALPDRHFAPLEFHNMNR